MSLDEVRSLMNRAKRSLRSAHNLLEDGDHDFAIARAYYAMFYAAKAALLSRDIARSKHSGVIAAFGEAFVKTGVLPEKHQKALQVGFRQRSESDYAGAFPSREHVDQRLAEAHEFVEAVRVLLTSGGIEL